MRSPARIFFVCLLVLGALLGGLACGGSGGTVSKSNVDRLNAANKHILGAGAEMEAAAVACKQYLPFSDKGLKCRGAHHREYYVGMKSAMAAYDQVASKTTDGKCQKALRQMALVIRVNIVGLGGDYPSVIEKTKKAVPPACDLKLVKTKLQGR